MSTQRQSDYILTVTRLAAEGLSCNQIAEAVGKTSPAIRKLCYRNKINLAVGFYFRKPIGEKKTKAVARAKLREKRGGAAAHNRIWNEANREKYLAHKAVETAVKRGKLNKLPCQVCGGTKLVHAHHDDYARKLDVIWLCPLHHKQRHKQLNAARMSGSTDIPSLNLDGVSAPSFFNISHTQTPLTQ